MSDTLQNINGELLRFKREERGWLVGDMATRACMSVKQIRQLEEGGSSSFYSESVKITSAKKVGAILGLTPEEVFASSAIEHEVIREETYSHLPIANQDEPNQAKQAPIVVTAESAPSESVVVPSPQPIQPEPEPTLASDSPVEQKNKTPLGAIAALFVAALAVAAWMRPEEPVAIEPPPPLQTLPAEAESAASAASAEAAAASSAASAPASISLSASAPTATSAASNASPAVSSASAAVKSVVLVQPVVGASNAARPAAPSASASSVPVPAAAASTTKPL
jgi:transcriptional regulator with XRE-family HTH domain